MSHVKVLALHGKYQNGEIFAKKIARTLCPKGQRFEVDTSGRDNKGFAVLKVWDKCSSSGSDICLTEYICVDAPFVEVPAVKLSNVTLKKRDGRGISSKANSLQCRTWNLEKSLEDPNVNESISSSLDKVIQERYNLGESPENLGVMGFSQGAALAALLCQGLIKTNIEWSPTFGIFISGYDSNKNLKTDECSPIERIHFLSDKDQRVCSSLSQKLYKGLGGTLITHEQGHNIPKHFHNQYRTILFS